LASILIGFGVAVLLFLGSPLGPLLFTFGLLSVCYLQADLYTGKAGYYWKTQKTTLLQILLINLASGYLFGILLGYSSPQLVPLALEKIATWNFSTPFFIKSVFCGMVMYICVELFKRGNFVGVLYGVPLFIFCGFQHSIANVIVLGIASCQTYLWSWTIVLCAAGNFIGSLIINVLSEG
jgi:formate/nitrite transporter FocA (FNT family)